MYEEENKKVALAFFENLSEGRIDAAIAQTADDLDWWLAGKPEQFALAGPKNKKEFANMLSTIEKGMPNGVRLTITGLTAEGDRGRGRNERRRGLRDWQGVPQPVP